MRLPRDAWRADHPWAAFYDFVVEHEPIARVGWALSMGTDVRLLYDAASEIGALPDGAVVLDVPVGGGVALRGLRPEQRITYLAADISRSMLARTAARAAAHGLQVTRVQADVGRLPILDGTVDLAVSFTGLHCFPDPERAVHELARVLRPGGVLTGSAFLNDTGRRYDVMRAVGRAAGLLGRSATNKELEAWLADAGFEQVRLRRAGALVYVRAVNGARG
jgi:ubiquinone/menaquinone biosynthesis C-methylase UbiE